MPSTRRILGFKRPASDHERTNVGDMSSVRRLLHSHDLFHLPPCLSTRAPACLPDCLCLPVYLPACFLLVGCGNSFLTNSLIFKATCVMRNEHWRYECEKGSYLSSLDFLSRHQKRQLLLLLLLRLRTRLSNAHVLAFFYVFLFFFFFVDTLVLLMSLVPYNRFSERQRPSEALHVCFIHHRVRALAG